MPEINESPLMTAKEAAKHLRVSVKTMYELVNSKTFPSIKIGRHHKILKHHLDEWLENKYKAKQKGLK